jgi:hypothetical protein
LTLAASSISLKPLLRLAFSHFCLLPLRSANLALCGRNVYLYRMKKILPVWSQEGITLDAFRSLLAAGTGGFVQFELIRHDPGFVLGIIILHGISRRGMYLMSEKSRQIRVFAKAETAFRLLEALGQSVVTVRLCPQQRGLKAVLGKVGEAGNAVSEP